MLRKKQQHLERMKVSEFRMCISKQQIHYLLGAFGPMIHSPAEPRIHQEASPHPPAVLLTPQWTPNTAALLPCAAARQPVNAVGHLKSVTDGMRCNIRRARYISQRKHSFFLSHNNIYYYDMFSHNKNSLISISSMIYIRVRYTHL